VFFFKPEVFLPGVNSRDLISYALTLFERHSIVVSSVFTMQGPALDRLQAMDTHYGYINAMSRAASREMAPVDLQRVRELVGAGENAPVRGGHEVLQEFPQYNPTSLDQLWATKRSQKVRSGLYAQQFDVANTQVVIINGFHPEQLAHFTRPGRAIGLLVLHSNLPWRFLRTRLLGDTFPENALPHTVRRHYYDNANLYGLPQISIANNCVHMSAGPFEALFELRNFFGRVKGHEDAADNSHLGSRLRTAGLNLDSIVTNPSAELNGKSTALFDATEELDTTGAIEVLRQLYPT
jgi:hypothetical protein